MTHLDSQVNSLKTALATLDPTFIVHISVGEASYDVSAAELRAALGIAEPAPIAAPTATRRVRVAAEFLRVRTEPTTKGQEVARLNRLEVVEVVDTPPVVADNYKWQKLSDGRGWIAIDFTEDPDKPIQISVPPSGAVQAAVSSISAAPSFALPFNANQRGVGTSAGGWAPGQRELELVRQNRVEFVLICAYEPNQAAHAIPALRNAGVQQFIIRACMHEPVTTPERYLTVTTPLIREYAAQLGNAPLMIALHNEPNLTKEGWMSAWRNGGEFANWYIQVMKGYRQTFPNAKIGFPAMSPGGDVPNLRLNEPTFIAQCAAAISASDWIGIHYYWQDKDGADINPPLAQWKAWFGDKPIVGTEVGPTDHNTITSHAMRKAYDAFARIGIPAVGWVLSGAGAWQNAAWDIHNVVV